MASGVWTESLVGYCPNMVAIPEAERDPPSTVPSGRGQEKGIF
jgi:hypothetical protein